MNLLYLVCGKDRGRQTWQYVLVYPDKLKDFIDITTGENAGRRTIDVTEYGTVVCSGWGQDPPIVIIEKIDFIYGDSY